MPAIQSSRSWSWEPNWRTTRVALFRLEDSGEAVLQHVRTTVVQQRGETASVIDADASLDDVPGWILTELEELDYQPTEVVV